MSLRAGQEMRAQGPYFLYVKNISDLGILCSKNSQAFIRNRQRRSRQAIDAVKSIQPIVKKCIFE